MTSTRKQYLVCVRLGLCRDVLAVRNSWTWLGSPSQIDGDLSNSCDCWDTETVFFIALQPLGSSRCRVCTITLRHTALGSPTQRTLPDNTQHSEEADIHANGRIRIRNSSKRAAADPSLTPRGHCYRGDREFTSFQILVCINAMGIVFCLLTSVTESDIIRDFCIVVCQMCLHFSLLCLPYLIT